MNLSTEFDIMNQSLYRLFTEQIDNCKDSGMTISSKQLKYFFNLANPLGMFPKDVSGAFLYSYLRVFLMDYCLKFHINLSLDEQNHQYRLINHKGKVIYVDYSFGDMQ